MSDKPQVFWQSSLQSTTPNGGGGSRPAAASSVSRRISSLYQYVNQSFKNSTSNRPSASTTSAMLRAHTIAPTTARATPTTTPSPSLNKREFSIISPTTANNKTGGGRPVRIAFMQKMHSSRRSDDGDSEAHITENDDSSADEERLMFNRHAFQQLLLAPHVRKLPVCVICVFGAYGTGKSFLLNFILRYLKSLSKTDDNENFENSDENSRVEGFEWCGNPDTTTEGLVAWSEPIIVPCAAATHPGKKLAVILLDTQGTFDMRASTRATFCIVTLGMLLSSVLIHNVQNKFGSNDLQQLRFFLQYSRSGAQAAQRHLGTASGSGGGNDSNPDSMQTLITLIRDWQHPHTYAYGSEGGQQLLNEKCALTNNSPSKQQQWNKNHHNRQQHGDVSIDADLKKVCRHLQQCFQQWQCCLLPHPGKNITLPNFSGSLQELEPDFAQEINQFITSTFSPEKLVVKQIFQKQQVTCSLLYEYALACAEQLGNNQHMPTIRQWADCTATLHNRDACDDAHRMYRSTLSGMEPYPVPDHQFILYHQQASRIAGTAFARRAIGSPQCISTERQRLNLYITESFSQQRQENEVNYSAIQHALKNYDACMDVLVARQEPVLTGNDAPSALQALHERGWTAAKRAFDSTGKRGSTALVDKCQQRLDTELNMRCVLRGERNERYALALQRALQTFAQNMQSAQPAYRLAQPVFEEYQANARDEAVKVLCESVRRDEDEEFVRACTAMLQRQLQEESQEFWMQNECKHWRLVHYMMWMVKSLFGIPLWRRP